MADSTSSGDPDADAVINGISAPAATVGAPASTGDPDVDAVIGQMHQSNPDPSPGIPFVSEFVNKIGTGIARTGAEVAGGYHGLYDLATGKGVDQAVSDIRSAQGSVKDPAPLPATKANQAADELADVPGRVFRAIGNEAEREYGVLGAPPEVGSAVNRAAQEALPFALGAKADVPEVADSAQTAALKRAQAKG